MPVPKRILIADPCPDNRNSMADLLAAYGYLTVPVDSLESLVARLTTVHADAVVTEVFGDPARTHRAVRAVAPGVPVAFHTTRARAAEVRESESLGCRHFIKPDGAMPLVAWLAGRFTSAPESAGGIRPGVFLATRPRAIDGPYRRQPGAPAGSRRSSRNSGRPAT